MSHMLSGGNLDAYRLVIRDRELIPIVIGGMGVDISTAELALEACRLGGAGHISDAMVPYLSDRYFRTRFQNAKSKMYEALRNKDDKPGLHWSPAAVYEASRKYVEATMSRKCGPGAVLINIMEKLGMGAPAETLAARLRGALDGGIDGITLSAGLHTGTLKLIESHARFRDALIGIIVSSARALKIFLRSASRFSRLPDYIVVEGPLAGGHLGFGEDWKKYNLRELVREVRNLLREEELDIPIIAAGGVFTGSDGVEMIANGAAGVQVATRFTISQECGLPEKVKLEYLRAEESDVVVNMTSPTGYPMRMLSYSPSLRSNVAPNCEALGYMLDAQGRCAYRDAYKATPSDTRGIKEVVKEKMCICYHFMKYTCYTCGHYVYRLKDTTTRFADGRYYLPRAEQIFNDYRYSSEGRIAVAAAPADAGSP